jgi:hypothetical protein
MHLLELTRLDLGTAANVLHATTDSVERWMTFNTSDPMPPPQWLLLNAYTLAVKGVCWPEQVEEYVRDRFPGAFADTIKPLKKVVVPDSPPIAPVDDIIDMLHDAGTTLEEIAFVQKNRVNSWLGPDKRFMPYAVYELTVMTLWARGKYIPKKDMAEYIHQKYKGWIALPDFSV